MRTLLSHMNGGSYTYSLISHEWWVLVGPTIHVK